MVNVSNISPNNQALRSGNTGSIFLQLVSHHCYIASWNPLLRVLPRLKVKSDHRSKFSNLNNWKEEAWKNQGFNGIRTRDLRDTGAMLYQLSYEATHWERGTSHTLGTAMIILHFHLQPQFIYELFHINFTGNNVLYKNWCLLGEKRSTAGAFQVPLRVLSREKYDRKNCVVSELVPLRGENTFK